MTEKRKAPTGGKSRIPELDGLRVLMIFVVSWYHIWQQSWLTPEIRIPALGVRWSLDWLLRSGYVWVDGTVLLSAFLLYLPLARRNRDPSINLGDFLFRKAKRILPGFWFLVLVFFFGMCLPWGLYNGNGPYMVKDLFTHLTLIFPFWRDTYIYTPMGAAPWTLSIVAQGYLLFPLLAKGMKKHPAVTLLGLTGAAFAFRAWCLWGMTDYSMVVNCLVNFLDVYAVGFLCALVYVRLEGRLREKTEKPAGGDRLRRFLRAAAAAAVFFGCLTGVCELLKVQASRTQAQLQAWQMIFRPAFALGMGGMVLSAPFMFRPLRFLLGNPVMKFLSALSMNYYLIHQTLAVHLKYRLHFPAYTAESPNMVGEQPWQTLYTLCVFGFSLLLAAAVTWGVEKPAGRAMEKWRARRKARENLSGHSAPESAPKP